MSNINNNFDKKHAVEPFRQANVPQGPGLTYGARMKFQKINHNQAPPPPTQTTIDQFKQKNHHGVSHAPNATYKSYNRVLKSERPYQSAILYGVENGILPRIKKGMPSDPTILNFLDKVIKQATQPLPAKAKTNRA